MPAATAAEWKPSPEDVAQLGERARIWLEAVRRTFILNELEGLRLLECMRVLTQIEALESVPGAAGVAALARERRLFLSQWAALNLEK